VADGSARKYIREDFMIEIEGETLVALREVSKLLPLRPNGKRVHISAIYRWVQRGIKGVRLEAIRIGGTTYTSREALQRFALPAGAPHFESTNQPSKMRQKQIDAAVKWVDEFLRPRKSRGGSGKIP
jgi:hypothetical protein